MRKSIEAPTVIAISKHVMTTEYRHGTNIATLESWFGHSTEKRMRLRRHRELSTRIRILVTSNAWHSRVEEVNQVTNLTFKQATGSVLGF